MKNKKISTRLMQSFLLTSLLTFILGIISISGFRSIENSYENDVVSRITLLNKISNTLIEQMEVRIDVLKMMYRNNTDNREKIESSLNNVKENLQNFRQQLVSLNADDSIINSTDKITERIEKYHKDVVQFINLVEENNISGAAEFMQNADVNENNEAIIPEIQELYNYISTRLNNFSGELRKSTFNINVAIIIVSVIILIVSLFIGIKISNVIKGQINQLLSMAKQIANGNLGISLRTNNVNELGELANSMADIIDVFNNVVYDINSLSEEMEKGNTDFLIDTEKYKGDFKRVADATNQMSEELIEDLYNVVNCIEHYAEGDFEINVGKNYSGKKVRINTAIDTIQNNLKSVSSDIKSLISTVSLGDFSQNVDTERYQKNWKDIVEGLNQLVFVVADPINEVSSVLSEVAEGNMKVSIKGNYDGEFATMKERVNDMISKLGSYISEISDILNNMSNQNLNVEITRDYIGDFSSIKDALIDIIESFNHLLGEVSSASHQISAGAKQISSSSVELAEGATEQAASIERLNSSMAELLSDSQNNTRSSLKARKLAVSTKEDTEKSRKQMENMVKSMNEISNYSKNISSIIKVIDDIAFQTNILALNAAVEAARAGEQGKGFSVVADEVRNLAAKSQSAARNTTELIENIVDKIEEGSVLLKQTSDALNKVSQKVEDIASIVSVCAENSANQQSSIDDVNSFVDDINSVTQNNTATSEQTAAASEELVSQAELFQEITQRFKLKIDL